MRLKSYFSTIITLAFCGVISAQIDFHADDSVVCAPATVKFSLDYTTVDTTTLTSILWDFGNGQTSNLYDPQPVSYPITGSFTVSIVIDGNIASPITKPNYIGVHQIVMANFDPEIITPPYEYQFTPSETITETSTTFSYLWVYRDDQNQMIRNITEFVTSAIQDNAQDVYVFPDTGYYEVSLKVRNMAAGCVDSVSQTIHVQEAADTTATDTTTYQVANLFMPELQDYFIIDPQDVDVVLAFKVFSRTGVLVYSEESPVINWDGRTNSGILLHTGVYFYVLEALRGDPDKYYSTRGFIHLFR
jgi:hypothetical protein